MASFIQENLLENKRVEFLLLGEGQKMLTINHEELHDQHNQKLELPVCMQPLPAELVC